MVSSAILCYNILMLEVEPEYLLNAVDEETLEKIWESMAGMRVYFPKNVIRHKAIQKAFKKIHQGTVSYAEAVRIVAINFEMSERQIREIVKKI